MRVLSNVVGVVSDGLRTCALLCMYALACHVRIVLFLTYSSLALTPSLSLFPSRILLLCSPPSHKQAAEWGMGAFQSSFKRCAGKLKGDKKQRGNELLIMVHLFNFRNRTTGINQIRTVYDPHYIGRDPDRNYVASYFHQALYCEI